MNQAAARGGKHMATLTATVVEELGRYFRHLAGRVERAVRSLPREKVYAKPFAFGNSAGHLVLHLTGNLNHYVGALIAGSGYVRNRPHEFTDPDPPPADEALQRFQSAVDLVVRTLTAQNDADLQAPITEATPLQTRFGMFLVCAAHLNNHVGQLAYIVQAHGHSTQEPPLW
jgi:uncharacterized damage-inducible protein DinB